MSDALDLVSVLCWTVVYIIIAYKGFKEKTYGMPVISLGINFAWEINLLEQRVWSLNGLYYFLWTITDVAIFVTFYKYAFHYTKPKKIKQSTLFVFATVYFLLAIIIIYLLTNFVSASIPIIAFTDNLSMSFFFILMLKRRGCTRGQSVIAATFKFIGTIAASISIYLYYESFIYIILGAIITILDLVYISLLLYYKKHTSFEIKKRTGIKF